MNEIRISGIRKSYGKKEVLRSVDLSAVPGMCVGILGVNGSGKSTLAAMLGVDYLIYGNVTDVSVSDTGTTIEGSGGVTVGTTKAHIVLRMMDVSTGDILMAAKGEGKSKTSYVEVGSKNTGVITIGTYTVTYDSVHNAIQKSAADAVNVLVGRLYGEGKAR